MAANKLIVKNCVSSDTVCLLENMREADRKEVDVALDLFKISIETYLTILLLTSFEKYAIYYGEELLACCGTLESKDPFEMTRDIWLLTTKAVERHKKSFIKGCGVALAKALKNAPSGLSVLTIDGYDKAHALNKFFGFVPMGQFDFNGKNFIKYVLRG